MLIFAHFCPARNIFGITRSGYIIWNHRIVVILCRISEFVGHKTPVGTNSYAV
ncbi:hypothetical protein D3C85_1263020 [compost metagenome]